ncbi:serine--tRNA ligase [Sodalis-like secondary symbiont of Drepanosiphum platanoidis]|uniref:serine--tRNA ligase n=1 Tax=Sodalis-like secondary symbiont of Drepanosiphum platanoidis TaxID=2994493 RepID=UPI0034639B24
MIDPKLLKKNINNIYKNLIKKNFILNIKLITKQENTRKILQIETEHLQSKHNKLSKKLGIYKKNKKNIKVLLIKINNIHSKLKILKNKLKILKINIKNYFLSIPNIIDNKVPIGNNKKYNKEILKWGNIKKYKFKIKNHIELGNINNGIDFSSASILTGSRFVIIKGRLALLHRALSQFMLDIHVNKHGYEEYYVPYIVNEESLYGTGQLPKFSKDLFYTNKISIKNKKKSYALIPTAEIPLTNILRNKIFQIDELPIKFTAHTPCFRSEAGSYGKNNKGLIRLHQFDKVEIFQAVTSEESDKTLDEITNHAEKILQLLNLPYRKVLLCSGETSFSSYKTYDLEVWFPSLNKFYEISSCSNMIDFQSRRIKARVCYKNKIKKNKFLHTLNGSGLAIGRTMAAILENYQQYDGSILIPKVLKKYMYNLKDKDFI